MTEKVMLEVKVRAHAQAAGEMNPNADYTLKKHLFESKESSLCSSATKKCALGRVILTSSAVSCGRMSKSNVQFGATGMEAYRFSVRDIPLT